VKFEPKLAEASRFLTVFWVQADKVKRDAILSERDALRASVIDLEAAVTKEKCEAEALRGYIDNDVVEERRALQKGLRELEERHEVICCMPLSLQLQTHEAVARIPSLQILIHALSKSRTNQQVMLDAVGEKQQLEAVNKELRDAKMLLEERVGILQGTVEELQRFMGEADEARSRLALEIMSLEVAFGEVAGGLDAAKSRLEDKVMALTAEIEGVCARLEEAEGGRATAEALARGLRGEVGALEAERETHKARGSQQVVALKEELANMGEHKAELEETISDLRQRVIQMEGEMGEAAEAGLSRLADSGRRIQELESQLGDANRRASELEGSVEDAEREMEYAEGRAEESKRERKAAEGREAEAKKGLEEAMRMLEGEREGLRVAKEDLARLSEAAEKREGGERELEGRVGDVEGAVVALGAAVGESERAKRGLEGRIGVLEGDNVRLERELGEARRTVEELEGRLRSRAGLEAIVAELEGRLTVSKEAEENLRGEADEARAMLAEKAASLTRAENEVASLSGKVGAAEGAADEARAMLQRQVAILEEKNGNLLAEAHSLQNDLKDEVEKNIRREDALRRALEEANEQQAMSQEELESLRNALNQANQVRVAQCASSSVPLSELIIVAQRRLTTSPK
jgi:chromosome segregation ATPase